MSPPCQELEPESGIQSNQSYQRVNHQPDRLRERSKQNPPQEQRHRTLHQCRRAVKEGER